MSTHTLSQLRMLKLGGMAAALQTQLEQVGTYDGLPFLDRLDLLLTGELYEGWGAGPISLAAGLTWRDEVFD